MRLLEDHLRTLVLKVGAYFIDRRLGVVHLVLDGQGIESWQASLRRLVKKIFLAKNLNFIV